MQLIDSTSRCRTCASRPDHDVDFTIISLPHGLHGGKEPMSELARHAGAARSELRREPRASTAPKEAALAKRPGTREPDGRLTTILRQSARKLAESANASGRNFGREKPEAATKMGYFLRFVRTRAFARRLLRM